MPTRLTKGAQPARDINHAMKVIAAVQMRLEGRTWEEIGQHLGIRGGKAGAYSLVNYGLKAARREADEQLRELENLRLDKLWSLCYARALAGGPGDLEAVDRCLRIMARRAALN